MGMTKRERISLKGRVAIWSRPKGAKNHPWKLEAENRNVIVDLAIDWIGYALIDESATYDTGITYQAIGTSTTTPAVTDTTLATESSRNPITAKSYDDSDQEIDLSTFFAAADCSVNIKEVGLFGATATSAADSGHLFNRALINYDNSAGTKDIRITTKIALAGNVL